MKNALRKNGRTDGQKQDSRRKTRPFGPFADVSTEEIKAAGFKCLTCRSTVEKLAMVVPDMLQRLVFSNCSCGTVVCWEDENQPDTLLWPICTDVMKRTGAKVLVFNGNRPIPSDF